MRSIGSLSFTLLLLAACFSNHVGVHADSQLQGSDGYIGLEPVDLNLSTTDQPFLVKGIEERSIRDTWILVFAENVYDASQASAILFEEVATGLQAEGAQAASGQDADALYPPEVVKIINAHPLAFINGVAAAPTMQAVNGTAAVSSKAANCIVAAVRAPTAAVHHMRKSALVKAVVPDLRVRAQAVDCIQPSRLNLGASAPAKPAMAAAFRAIRCNIANAKLVWKGKRCGAGNSIAWYELRALGKGTNAQLYNKDGKPCLLKPGSQQSANRQRFGTCGSAPVLAPDLPSKVCSARNSKSPPPWNMDDTAVTSGGLPRVAVRSEEQLPAGIRRIEAAKNGQVGDMTQGRDVLVAVIDSGVDSHHPDLNYQGGISFAHKSDAVPNDRTDPDFDLYGHGTHVAGIMGARNQGSGVVGVLPNVGIFSIKILDAEGVGALSDALAAMSWLLNTEEGRAKGIRVVNLSLAAFMDPSASPGYQDTFNIVCSIFKAAADAGVIVVAAAGNYQQDLKGYLPAACPSVLAVTSMDSAGNEPSSFSNYLEATAASTADKASTIAAPGNGILSTVSYVKDVSGYRELSGTSMASPHVAGVAAACISSGACSGLTGSQAFTLIQATARQRLTAGKANYGFTGDPSDMSDDRYYGFLTWAGF